MSKILQLFDVFPTLAANWPFGTVAESMSSDRTSWLTRLNNAFRLNDLVVNNSGGSLGICCRFHIEQVERAELRFRHAHLGGIEFILQNLEEEGAGYLFVKVGEHGTEILIEGLPVQMSLPADLIGLHPKAKDVAEGEEEEGVGEDEIDTGELVFGGFEAGDLNTQEIIYQENNRTRVKTHFRIHVHPDMRMEITTPLPISFGLCTFLGFPCLGVYDFQLIPDPSLAYDKNRRFDQANWLRHGIQNATYNGVFGVRTIYFDFEYWSRDGGQFSNLLRTGRRNFDRSPDEEESSSTSPRQPKAEWTFKDLVFPFVFPMPVHATVGFRKNIAAFTDLTDLFAFDNAPVFLPLRLSDSLTINLRIYQLCVQTAEIRDVLDFFKSFQIKIGISIPGAPQRRPSTAENDNTAVDTETPGEPQTTPGRDELEILLELAENATARLGFTYLPGRENIFFRLVITDNLIIDGIGGMVGYSFGKMAEGKGFGDCFQLTGTFWVHDNRAAFPNGDPAPVAASSASSSGLNGESADGEPFSMVIEELGWKNGAPTYKTFELPEGTRLKFDTFALDILEVGVASEDGASYFFLSAGLHINTSGFEGGVWLHRMRFKISGNPAAADFKLDGFTLLLKVPEVVKITASGYHTTKEETKDGITIRIQEMGLSGRLELLTPPNWLVAVDFIQGNYWQIDPPAPNASFDYLMIQAAVRGSIPLGALELRTIRFLLADDMMPKAPKNSNGMRYYKWNKDNDPLGESAGRNLRNAWRPERDSWGFGIGLGVSINSAGDVFSLKAFVMYVEAPDERGLLIALELFLGRNMNNPVGWAILEYDFINDRFSILIGVDVTLKTFIDAPEQIGNLFKIKGTIFIGNKPGTFAIGRIADEQSWLMLLLELDLWNIVKAYVKLAFCVEIVEGGQGGVGLIFRLEGRSDMGLFTMGFLVGLMFKYQSFKNGASDFAVLFVAEASLTLAILRFISIGLNLRFEVSNVGHRPNYTLLRLTINIDLPFFLPDISWTMEIVEGNIRPSERSMLASPLLAASARQESTQVTYSLFSQRFSENMFSLADIHGGIGLGERLEQFEAFLLETDAGKSRLLPTDATIALCFSSPVEDACGISSTTDSRFASQPGGDEAVKLSMHLKLIGISIRKRPRYGEERAWSPFSERRELEVRLDGGHVTTGAFEASQLSMMWSADYKIAGNEVAKTLLLNASTPFEFGTINELSDDEILRRQPNWPCCPENRLPLHEYFFQEEEIGRLNAWKSRRFPGTNSLIYVGTEGVIKPPLSSDGGVCDRVASFKIGKLCTLLHVVLEEDAFRASVRMSGVASETSAWSVRLLAEDFDGEPVGSASVSCSPFLPWTEVEVRADRPFRSLVVMIESQQIDPLYKLKQSNFFEIEKLTYVAWGDYQRWQQANIVCKAGTRERNLNYSGRGKIFFLPNYEYEIALTTELSVRHSSTEWERKTLTEYAYFATKGLPGLNRVERIGEEVEPYVAGRYSGPRNILYRNEPAIILFNEQFIPTFPLIQPERGERDEHLQLIEMVLETSLDNANEPDEEAQQRQDNDWLDHHQPEFVRTPWRINTAALSFFTQTSDPFRLRLSRLTQAARPLGSPAVCEIEDAARVQQQALIARPPTAANGQALWLPGRKFSAKVKLKTAPLIHRKKFKDNDLRSFGIMSDTGMALSSEHWRIENGSLNYAYPDQLQYAVFGDSSWSHFELKTTIVIGEQASGAAGVAIGLNENMSRGVFVLVHFSPSQKRLVFTKNGEPIAFPGEVILDLPSKFEIKITAWDDVAELWLAGKKVAAVALEDLRQGRCSLLAQGEPRFSSLLVEGVTLSQFGFSSSQFASFAEHMQAFKKLPGRLSVLGEAAAWQSMRPEILAGMTPATSDEEREDNFARVVEGLGIPLLQRVEQPQITVLEQSGGPIALLLESPEPLDFVREITLRLNLRAFSTGIKLISEVNLLRKWLEQLEEEDQLKAPHWLQPSAKTPWELNPVVKKLTAKAFKKGKRLTLGMAPKSPPLEWKHLVYLELEGDSVSLFSMDSLKPEIGYVQLEKQFESLGVKSVRLLLDVERRQILYADRAVQTSSWQTLAFDLVQNGQANRALVFPAAGILFQTGSYSLAFNLLRRRFTSEVLLSEAVYSDSAAVTIAV